MLTASIKFQFSIQFAQTEINTARTKLMVFTKKKNMAAHASFNNVKVQKVLQFKYFMKFGNKKSHWVNKTDIFKNKTTVVHCFHFAVWNRRLDLNLSSMQKAESILNMRRRSNDMCRESTDYQSPLTTQATEKSYLNKYKA